MQRLPSAGPGILELSGILEQPGRVAKIALEDQSIGYTISAWQVGDIRGHRHDQGRHGQ